MKVEEFVKTHGTKVVSGIVKHYGNHTHVTDDARMFITEEFYKRTRSDYVDDLNSMVKMVDLKRIVESHELVERIGGIEKAKIRCYPAKHLTMESYHDLRKAIADVEACQ